MRLLRSWFSQRLRAHYVRSRPPVSQLPALVEAQLAWIGQFIGNASHLLHGNGGGGGGGGGKGGKGSKGQDHAGGAPFRAEGHNPAWQAWMPRAYQEQKEELEKFRRVEQEGKQKKEISSRIRDGFNQMVDGIMGG
eukprot:5053656-Alexandrium_andersonii.AAC.1